ncbi:MAG: hypothetical protein ACRC1Z_20590 [Waterburya sp.]
MMNSIQNDVRLLELHLQRFPQEATELATAYFEDYLVLASEYDNLIARLKQLQQSKKAFVPQYPFADAQLNLEQEFRVKKLSRFLAHNPSKAQFWAILYFHNYLILAEFYRQAEAEFNSLCDHFSSPNQPSLPYFL